MSSKHWICLFIATMYLFVVGFAEFPPRKPKTPFVKPLPLAVLPERVNTSIKEPTLTFEEHKEKETMAKVIASKYKQIDYVTSMKLVTAVYDKAKEQKLDPKLVLAFIATESAFNKNAISSENAIGYLQIIPKWHRSKIRGRDIRDLRVNVEVGTKILRECYTKFSSVRNVFGCYNGATTDENKDLFYASIKSNLTKLNKALIASR